MSRSGSFSSLSQMVLTITEQCNQRCSYCYVPKERGRTMELDVAERALDLFFASAKEAEPLSIAFFGGEPFLVPGLMRQIAEAALARAGRRRVVFSATTNATAVDDEGLALIRDLELKLAVSHDGHRGQRYRPLCSGEPSLPALRQNLKRLLEQDGAVALARMTVTPQSVHGFADDVRSVFADGIRSILYLPAFEADWDDQSADRWVEEHRRLVTWLAGLEGAGRPGPTFPAWRSILSRLAGSPRRHCGAGTTRIAISPEGKIHPCYRTIYDPGGDRLALGDVRSGLTRPQVLSAMTELDPDQVRPQEGRCDGCPARDGCTFFCPALGHLLLQDLRAVPRWACRLTRAQVEMCRRLLQREREGARKPTRLRWAAVLAAAFLGGGLSSCHRSPVSGPDIGPADGPRPEGTAVSDSGPGEHIFSPDSGPDLPFSPGLCPPPLDSGPATEMEPDQMCYPGYGGIC